MAEAIGTASAIVGIVSFGLELASALQTFISAVQEAEERLTAIAQEIGATAAALQQLQTLIDRDKAEETENRRVFKDAGLDEIVSLAGKCHKVYETIAELLGKAAGTEAKNGANDDKDDGTNGISFESSTSNRMQNVTVRVISLGRRMRWPWLEPRITRCHEQLRWLKMSLLFDLQVHHLASFQIR
jgi:hypothetical protein